MLDSIYHMTLKYFLLSHIYLEKKSKKLFTDLYRIN